jgi:hypothetical protein
MSLSDNPFAYKNVKWSGLGTDVPSLGGTDWGSMVGPEAWRGFTSDKKSKSSSSSDALKAAGIFSDLLSKAAERKYRGMGEQSEAKIGDPMGGKAGQVLDNLGAVFPQQHAPIVIPGVENQGGKGIGQRIAGGAAGAFQGFLSGAAHGGPHMAGIGALVGGIGGAL